MTESLHETTQTENQHQNDSLAISEPPAVGHSPAPVTSEATTAEPQQVQPVQAADEYAESEQDTDPETTVQKESPEKEEFSPQSYLGKEYTINDRRFVVDRVSQEWNTVSLRDITFENHSGFPIFRSEPIDFLRYLEPDDTSPTAQTEKQHQNDDLVTSEQPVTESLHKQAQSVPEQLAFVPLVSEAPRVTQTIIDQALRLGGNEPRSLQVICAHFAKGYSSADNAAFLKEVYGEDGKGFYSDGTPFSLWFDEEGIRIAEGKTAAGKQALVLSWEETAERVRELLDHGQYVNQAILDTAPDYERKTLAESLWYVVHDFSDKAKQQNFMPAVCTLYKEYSGFPDASAQIKKLLENPEQAKTTLSEYMQFYEAYQQDRELMRFHYHKMPRIAGQLQGVLLPQLEFTAQQDFSFQEPKQFITDDEIDKLLSQGSNVSGSKNRIQAYYQEEHTPKERVQFLKNEYGWGGHGASGFSKEHSTKGISYCREDAQNKVLAHITLNWDRVEKRIGKLIRQDRYFTEKAPQVLPAVEQPMTESPHGTAQTENQHQNDNLAISEPPAVGHSPAPVAPDYPASPTIMTSQHQNDTLVISEPTTAEPQQEQPVQAADKYAESEQDTDPEATVQKEIPEKEEFSPQSYLGKEYTINDRRFVVDRVSQEWNTVSLRDITFESHSGFPIFRSEPIDFLRYLEPDETSPTAQTEKQHQNDDLVVSEPPAVGHSPAPVAPDYPASPTIKTSQHQNDDLATADQPVVEHKQAWPAPTADKAPQVYGGQKTKYKNNAGAIRLVKQLAKENRTAEKHEKEVLAKYTGWGGIPQAFDSKNQKWSTEYQELRELLTQAEYRQARGSTLNAHYTTPVVIQAMYKAVHSFGLTRGIMIEPAMGTGNFFSAMPESMDFKQYGVELDNITGQIAQHLHPQAQIQIKGFEETQYPENFFDLAVGNVPFGSYSVYDSKYRSRNFLIHDYFIAKSLDILKPGGIAAFITSKGTLDKADPTVRKYFCKRAELIGAVRLPSGTFKGIANTEVTSDILFFQKRPAPLEIEEDWVHLGQTEDGIPVNQYYVQNPHMMLGKMEYHANMYEFLHTPQYQRKLIELVYNRYNTNWTIYNKTLHSGVRVTAEYGTKRANAYKIIEDTLNLRPTTIYDYVENEKDNLRRVVNGPETQIARMKQEVIKQEFIKNAGKRAAKAVANKAGSALWKACAKYILPYVWPVFLGFIILVVLVAGIYMLASYAAYMSSTGVDENDIYYLAIQELQQEYGIEGSLDASFLKSIDYVREDIKSDVSDVKQMLMDYFMEGTGENGLKLSEAVLKHQAALTKYAEQEGIGEYVNLLMAVMMQESGGRGKDPMQSSECQFNEKYPRKMEGITDPDYSIQVGVKNFADCLKRAGSTSSGDMEKVKLALMGYNMGQGFISWAEKRGGYSDENAKAFSEKEKKRLGWDSYGDPKYIEHVLRYYSGYRWKERSAIMEMLKEEPFRFSEGDFTQLEEYLKEFGVSSESEESTPAGDLPPETGGFIYPVPTHKKITSHYGSRSSGSHGGTDFGAPEGTPVVASKSGLVISAGTNVHWSYGNCVRIQHDDGTITLYAHNSALTVKVGQRVQQGQQIAKVGNTGRSFGAHCHFEIRVNGKRINPEPVLAKG